MTRPNDDYITLSYCCPAMCQWACWALMPWHRRAYVIPIYIVVELKCDLKLWTNVNLHGEVVDETQPSTRMFEKDIQPLLERFPPSMMEHIFGFECLIDWQCNRIVRIRYTGSGDHRFGLFITIVVIFAGHFAGWNAWWWWLVVQHNIIMELHRGTHTATFGSVKKKHK